MVVRDLGGRRMWGVRVGWGEKTGVLTHNFVYDTMKRVQGF